ncbi:MAG: hypothetical protein ACLTE2_00550 [Eubacteriales bacterium]
MNEILLLKLGELVLKGLNRKLFENVLLKRIQYTLCDLGKFDIKLAQSTITIVPQEETIDLEEAAERVSKYLVLQPFSRARVTEKYGCNQTSISRIFGGRTGSGENIQSGSKTI